MKLTALLLPCAALAAAVTLASGQRGGDPFAVPADKVEKIKAGLPEKAPAPVKKKHELLVFTKTAGFRHASIPVGVETLKQLGEKTGLFNVTHTEDPAVFEPDSLTKFDGVMMLNTTGEVFKDDADKDAEERRKQALVAFVKSGKGLMGLHSATDTYHNWKEYNDMMGGAFVSHPWNAGDTVTVKNLDPEHPLTAAFKGQGFKIKDEIYKFRADTAKPDERRVLLALDPDGTDMSKDRNDKRDLYPIAWVDTYGGGRVFYCSLGHNDEVYWNPAVVEHYLAGIQYALGELEADATPKAVARIGFDGKLMIVRR